MNSNICPEVLPRSILRAGKTLLVTGTLLTLACSSCDAPDQESTQAMKPSSSSRDPHSFARPDEVSIRHLNLDLTVDFELRRLHGRASLEFDRQGDANQLHLDSRGLEITAIELDDGSAAKFELGSEQPWLGQELIIELKAATTSVHIDYASSPGAEALLWMQPEQTAGGRHPFLFSQSQAILARTWVPCQDSPAVRMTYDATLRVPAGLLALMSAENPTEKSADGVYNFQMRQPVPSYLLALAVGDLEFRSMGARTGVYAEAELIDAAAWEFAETEAMMEAVEPLYGPYRWQRYDLLVLPTSFPFGGMENPRLTFLTPTVIAGDRSLVSLVAHELAHSWSGNLVTNANWNDFWLNEGFTVYLERRIMEELEGREYSEMLALLGQQDLEQTFAELGAGSPDSHLRLDLAGRNADDGMTDVAYEKGYFLLRTLEEAVGRSRFDAFLRDYFAANAFHSLTTDGFVEQLNDQLLRDPQLAAQLDLAAWIDGPGLPPSASLPTSERFAAVDTQLVAWSAGTLADQLLTAGWTTHEWLHFLRSLPQQAHQRAAELDQAFGFTASGNSEILCAWLLHTIDQGYEPAYPALEHFLTSIGRRKFLQPLYESLAKSESGMERARQIYQLARPSYHSVSTGTIDEILEWNTEGTD